MSNTITSEMIHSLESFKGLSENYLNEILEGCKVEQFEKGEILFRRGKPLTTIYFLINGSVELLDYQYQATQIHIGLSDTPVPLSTDQLPAVSAVAKSDIELISLSYDLYDMALAWSGASLASETFTQDIDTDFGIQTMPDLAIVEEPHSDNTDFDLRDAVVDVDEATSWFSHLLVSSVFKRLPASSISELLANFEAVTVQEGEVILKEGEEGDYFYAIESGSVSLSNITGSLNLTLGTGSFFGEEALVSEAPRNATAVMAAAGVLQRLEKTEFQRLLHEPTMHHIDAEEIDLDSDNNCVVDVRLAIECRLTPVYSKAVNVPISALRSKISDLDQSIHYAVLDNAGRRSELCVYLLAQAGFQSSLLNASSIPH